MSRLFAYAFAYVGVALFLLFSFASIAPAVAHSAASRGSYGVSVFLWRSLAALGDSNAQSGLGWSYGNGRGVGQDAAMAVYWYQEAANKGMAEAQFHLAEHYRTGEGVRKDIELAKFWLEKAAGQNFHSAQHNLGLLFADGTIDQDFVKATMWLQLAIMNGSQSAPKSLAYYAKVMTDAEIQAGLRRADDWLAERKGKISSR